MWHMLLTTSSPYWANATTISSPYWANATISSHYSLYSFLSGSTPHTHTRILLSRSLNSLLFGMSVFTKQLVDQDPRFSLTVSEPPTPEVTGSFFPWMPSISNTWALAQKVSSFQLKFKLWGFHKKNEILSINNYSQIPQKMDIILGGTKQSQRDFRRVI